MYIIINSTTRKSYRCSGLFPASFLEEGLNRGEQLLVISLYSNTIKVPYALSDEHVKSYRLDSKWEWYDFDFPEELIKF